MSELNMETPGEDAAEEVAGLADDEELEEVPLEVNEADAAEQARPAAADAVAADDDELGEVPLEVNEADAAEQTRDAGYDDEDYR